MGRALSGVLGQIGGIQCSLEGRDCRGDMHARGSLAGAAAEAQESSGWAFCCSEVKANRQVMLAVRCCTLLETILGHNQQAGECKELHVSLALTLLLAHHGDLSLGKQWGQTLMCLNVLSYSSTSQPQALPNSCN